MLDKNEIEERLQDVAMPLVMALASRCALRTLPFLAARASNPFPYWQEHDRASHLLGIFCAQHLGLTAVAIDEECVTSACTRTIEEVYTDTVSAANRALSPRAVRETYAAAYVARSSSRAIYCTAKQSIEYAAKVVADACYSAKSIDDAVSERFFGAVTFDLDTITLAQDRRKKPSYLRPFTPKQTHHNINRLSFLSSPLWGDGTIPEEINVYWQRLRSWADALNCGFAVWLHWYKERMDGRAIDVVLMRKINEMSDTLIVRGPAVPLYNKALKELLHSPRKTGSAIEATKQGKIAELTQA